ncbi:hypothetical protein IWX47DRAFT_940995, partial [Phyllosticta citricarpa]
LSLQSLRTHDVVPTTKKQRPALSSPLSRISITSLVISRSTLESILHREAMVFWDILYEPESVWTSIDLLLDKSARKSVHWKDRYGAIERAELELYFIGITFVPDEDGNADMSRHNYLCSVDNRVPGTWKARYERLMDLAYKYFDEISPETRRNSFTFGPGDQMLLILTEYQADIDWGYGKLLEVVGDDEGQRDGASQVVNQDIGKRTSICFTNAA